ncbi:hypothetical protein GLA29479_2137 [Lysobacter antibioticus]|nr:hypothetical protein GLA29479_2137 [Lysobacter antibioticus]
MRAALRVFCCLRECGSAHSNSNSNSNDSNGGNGSSSR